MYKILNSVFLKIHKIEIFFGFDFEIFIISLLVMSKYQDFTQKFFDWAIFGGGTIFPRSPRTTQNEKNIELGQKIFLFFFLCEPFIWANTSFSEIHSLTAPGMALRVNLGPNVKIYSP